MPFAPFEDEAATSTRVGVAASESARTPRTRVGVAVLCLSTLAAVLCLTGGLLLLHRTAAPPCSTELTRVFTSKVFAIGYSDVQLIHDTFAGAPCMPATFVTDVEVAFLRANDSAPIRFDHLYVHHSAIAFRCRDGDATHEYNAGNGNEIRGTSRRLLDAGVSVACPSTPTFVGHVIGTNRELAGSQPLRFPTGAFNGTAYDPLVECPCEGAIAGGLACCAPGQRLVDVQTGLTEGFRVRLTVLRDPLDANRRRVLNVAVGADQVEYDIPTCGHAGCVHTREYHTNGSAWGATSGGLVKLAHVVAHGHVGFLSQELWIEGALICRSEARYADNLLYGISDCTWTYEHAPQVPLLADVVTITKYNSTIGHWGAMNMWQGFVYEE